MKRQVVCGSQKQQYVTSIRNSFLRSRFTSHGRHSISPIHFPSDPMVATVIDGKAVAQTIRSEISFEVRHLSQKYGKVIFFFLFFMYNLFLEI